MSLLQSYFTRTPDKKRSSAAIAYLAALDHIQTVSPATSQAIIHELNDQRSHLKLIASENYSSLATQLAMGNLLTDKYAEGYPHHRFYAGCENVDNVEEAACNTLKEIFGCDHAFVQPHSGADANLLAFWAILTSRIQNKELEKLGGKRLDKLSPEEYERIRQEMLQQKILGMSLNSGGHLTHGYIHNISSKMMRASSYDVDPETEKLDYSALAKQVREEKPAILIAGYSAHSMRLNFAKMREIADSVGAVLLVDMAHFSGLVAGKVFTGEYNPVPYAHIVTSTTHKTLRGPRGGIVLCQKEFAEAVNKGCPLVMGGPLPHVIAAKALAFKEANTQEFQHYARKVVDNAKSLADALGEKGIRLVSGGTENHLVLLDISSFNITGKQGELALREAKLTTNRNAVPFDTKGVWFTSGIRIGTAAITTLGMGTEEMQEIAELIYLTLKGTKATVDSNGQQSKAEYTIDKEILHRVQKRVEDLLVQFPLYPEITIEH